MKLFFSFNKLTFELFAENRKNPYKDLLNNSKSTGLIFFLKLSPVFEFMTFSIQKYNYVFQSFNDLEFCIQLGSTPRPRAALLMCLSKYSAIGNSAI